jgi:hypothetical protein
MHACFWKNLRTYSALIDSPIILCSHPGRLVGYLTQAQGIDSHRHICISISTYVQRCWKTAACKQAWLGKLATCMANYVRTHSIQSGMKTFPHAMIVFNWPSKKIPSSIVALFSPRGLDIYFWHCWVLDLWGLALAKGFYRIQILHSQNTNSCLSWSPTDVAPMDFER